MAEKCHFNKFIIIFLFLGLNLQMFPPGKAHKAHFSTSMCYIESLYFALPYPLNWLPYVSSNNMRHLELKNSSAYLFFGSTN